eukprot:3650130-Amphidinium_carterae.1
MKEWPVQYSLGSFSPNKIEAVKLFHQRQNSIQQHKNTEGKEKLGEGCGRPCGRSQQCVERPGPAWDASPRSSRGFACIGSSRRTLTMVSSAPCHRHIFHSGESTKASPHACVWLRVHRGWGLASRTSSSCFRLAKQSKHVGGVRPPSTTPT